MYEFLGTYIFMVLCWIAFCVFAYFVFDTVIFKLGQKELNERIRIELCSNQKLISNLEDQVRHQRECINHQTDCIISQNAKAQRQNSKLFCMELYIEVMRLPQPDSARIYLNEARELLLNVLKRKRKESAQKDKTILFDLASAIAYIYKDSEEEAWNCEVADNLFNLMFECRPDMKKNIDLVWLIYKTKFGDK